MTVVKVPGEGAVRQPRAVAIGVFDGVHLGHRAVLRHVLEAERAVPVVLTFADSPRALPKKAEALFTEEEKRAFYENNQDLFGRYHGDLFDYEDVRQIIEKRLREDAYDKLIQDILCQPENRA